MFEFFSMMGKMPGPKKGINPFDVIYGIIALLFVHVGTFIVKVLDLAGLNINKNWEPGQKMQVLFLAYSGARNTGAEVRVAECIDQVNMVLGEDRAQINMTTLNLADTKEYFKGHNANFIQMNAVFFWDVFKFVLNNHVVVLVEGSCWKENFSAALLLYFLYGGGLSAKLGKCCFSYGVDAGDMNWFNNMMSWHFSHRMDALITRSSDSSKVLDKILLPDSWTRVDTAWTQRANTLDWARGVLRERGWDGKKPLVGLCMQNFFWWPIVPDFVRWVKTWFGASKEWQYKLLYFYDYDEEDMRQYENWKKMLAAHMDWAAEKYGVQPVLIAMEALDERSCKEAAAQMKNKAIIISCNEFVGIEIAALLRSLTILLTTRYHGMLLSMPGCVPFIGLSRDERIRGVMKETGLYDDYYLDYKDPEFAQKLKDKTARMMESEAERKRVSGVVRKNLPYYFAQMALLGLDIRKIIKKYYPRFEPVALNEDDPTKMIPFTPPELKDDIQKKFLELKREEAS